MPGDAGAAGAGQPEVARYLNRLSDHLFVLARLVNSRAGVPETILGAPAAGGKGFPALNGGERHCTVTASGVRVANAPLSVKVAVAL